MTAKELDQIGDSFVNIMTKFIIPGSVSEKDLRAEIERGIAK